MSNESPVTQLIERMLRCGRAVLEGTLHELQPALPEVDLEAFFATELGRAVLKAGADAVEMYARERRFRG